MVSSLWDSFLSFPSSFPSLAYGRSGYQCWQHEWKETPFLSSGCPPPPSPYCEASSSWHVEGANEDPGCVSGFCVFSARDSGLKCLS